MREKSELLKWMESVEPIARELREKNREEGEYQPGSQLPPTDLRWNYEKGNEMLVTGILEPLLDIIYLYDESDCYQFVPGTTEDLDAGWVYFEKCFRKIYRALNQNLYISHEIYLKVLKIIEEVQSFVRSFSGADGLPQRYFEVNPNLRFYTVGFKLWEEDKEAYNFVAENEGLKNEPAAEDFILQETYFEKLNSRNERNNFKHDINDFFIMELAYTLRLIFLKDLSEYTP